MSYFAFLCSPLPYSPILSPTVTEAVFVQTDWESASSPPPAAGITAGNLIQFAASAAAPPRAP